MERNLNEDADEFENEDLHAEAVAEASVAEHACEAASEELDEPKPKRQSRAKAHAKGEQQAQQDARTQELLDKAMSHMARIAAEKDAVANAAANARAAEESRLRAERDKEAEQRSLAAAEKAIANLVTYPIPSRQAITGAALIFGTAEQHRAAVSMAASGEYFQSNLILAADEAGLREALRAKDAGRTVVFVDLGASIWGSMVDLVPDAVLSWQARSGVDLYCIRQSHSTWRTKQIKERHHYGRSSAAFEESREIDRSMRKTPFGVNMLIAHGHVEQVTAKEAKEAFDRRRAAAAEKLEEDRRTLMRSLTCGVGGMPALASVDEILRVSGGRIAWLVEGLLPRDGIAAIFGPQEQGKSKVGAALAAAAATGQPFCGMEVNGGKPCRVVYVALEHGLGAAIDIAANVTPDRRDLLQRNLQVTSAWPRIIGGEEGAMEAFAKQLGKIDLIVVDTYTTLLARNGANEVNGAAQVIDSFRMLASVTGSTVLFQGHTTKRDATDERGASLRDAADCLLPISKESGQDGEMVVRIGQGSKGAKHRHRAWPRHDLLLTFRAAGHGMQLVAHAEVPPLLEKGAKAASGRKAVASSKVLDALRRIGKQAGLAEIVEATGLHRATCSAQLGRLVGAGKVALTVQGKARFWATTPGNRS